MSSDPSRPTVQLVLASASAGRLATLRRAGIEPHVLVSGVDEDLDEPDPVRHATTLAERKAGAVAGALQRRAESRAEGSRLVVLGCDSVLELDGEIHGKPRDAREATSRWQRMRGRDGVLHTGHCLVDLAGGRRLARAAATTVRFADLTDDEVAAYVGTGEPLQVAGGFTIDGFGGPFVERIDGDPHNVIGLSLPLLRQMLREIGVPWPALWSPGATRPPAPEGTDGRERVD